MHSCLPRSNSRAPISPSSTCSALVRDGWDTPSALAARWKLRCSAIASAISGRRIMVRPPAGYRAASSTSSDGAACAPSPPPPPWGDIGPGRTTDASSRLRSAPRRYRQRRVSLQPATAGQAPPASPGSLPGPPSVDHATGCAREDERHEPPGQRSDDAALAGIALAIPNKRSAAELSCCPRTDHLRTRGS